MRTEAAKRKCSFCWRTVFAAKGPFGATVINLAARLCDEARDGLPKTTGRERGKKAALGRKFCGLVAD